MTRSRAATVLMVTALLAVTGAGAARAADRAAPRISVVFVEPARFTDARDAALASERGSARILDDLAGFVREVGEREVPAGLSLEVRVTDVDLAGEFEPWRGPRFERTRFFREAYWPRIDLEFTLRDGEGRVVREGRRSLRDLTYLTRAGQLTDDPLRYEKAMLREWLRSEFAP